MTLLNHWMSEVRSLMHAMPSEAVARTLAETYKALPKDENWKTLTHYIGAQLHQPAWRRCLEAQPRAWWVLHNANLSPPDVQWAGHIGGVEMYAPRENHMEIWLCGEDNFHIHFGRSTSNDIILRLANIARRHGSFHRDHSKPYISARDHGSTNGLLALDIRTNQHHRIANNYDVVPESSQHKVFTVSGYVWFRIIFTNQASTTTHTNLIDVAPTWQHERTDPKTCTTLIV